MDQLAQHIESLIFTATSPIAFKELKGCLEESFDTKLKKPAIEKAIGQLKERYQQDDFSFELVEIAGGFQFLTKASFHNTIGVYLKQTTKKRLSKAALETLSIIAYKQPVVKSEMEKIRGVSCDYSVQKLLEKELIAIVGRSVSPGQPLLYGTSEKFMDYFGLKSIEDLPKPKDFKEPDSEIGEKAPIDEKINSADEQVVTATAAPSSTTASEESVEDTVTPIVVEEKDPTAALQNIPPSAASDTSDLLPDIAIGNVADTSLEVVEETPTTVAIEETEEILEKKATVADTSLEVAEGTSATPAIEETEKEEEASISTAIDLPTSIEEEDSLEPTDEDITDI